MNLPGNRISGGLLALAVFTVQAGAIFPDRSPDIRLTQPESPPKVYVAGVTNSLAIVKSARPEIASRAPSSTCAPLLNKDAISSLWVTDGGYAPHCWAGCSTRFLAQDSRSGRTKGRLVYTGDPCK